MRTVIEKSGNSIIQAENIEKGNELNQFVKLLTGEVAHLESNIVMSSPDLISRDLDDQFVDLMDTVEIQIPAVFEGRSFKDGDTITPQDTKKGKVAVTLDEIFDVTVEFSSKELTDAVEAGASTIIRSMTIALRQKIDTYFANVIKNRTSRWIGSAGSTPNAITDLTGAELMLNIVNAPDMDRNLVIDSYAKEKFLQLPEFKNLDVSGSTAGLINSNLGRKFTLNMFTTNNVPVHTAGTYATNGVAHVVTKTGVAKLDDHTPVTLLTITETSAPTPVDGLLVEGDIFTYVDNASKTRYGIIAETPAGASVAGVISVKVITDLPAGDAVTAKALVFADKTVGGSVRNLIWQKSGVVGVSRPIRPFPDKVSVSLYTPEGYPLRLTWGSDQLTKKNLLSLDTIVKGVVVRPELVKGMLG
jgi:hypothetical protein